MSRTALKVGVPRPLFRSIFAVSLIAGSPGLACLPSNDQPAGIEIETNVHALTSTIGLSADAYVRSGSYAGTNFGTATTLNSDSDDGSTTLWSYLRFSIGNVGTISSAKLRLYVADTSAGPHTVKRVSNTSWGETSINWNNKPAVDGVLVATIGSASSGSWIELDITSVAQPNSTISLAIQPGSTDGLDLRSRNHTSNQPQVVIVSGGGGGSGGAGGGAGGAGGTGGGGAGGGSGTVATEPNLKVAFIGDTANGSSYNDVLNLIMQEGAQAMFVAGDMTYSSNPAAWWSATEAVVEQSYPVFLARGNHDDSSWSGFLAEAATHRGGATHVAGPHDAAYKDIYRGLTAVAIKKGDTNTTVNNLFGSDNHIWKVCYWHQNQNKLQVGGKGDEMGYGVFEACRQKGAIIINGHEHTYHRTKTLINTQTQTIDPSCASGSSLCVGPNRTFVSVVGTGGTGLRAQVRCLPTASSPPFASLNTSDASCPIWASIYTTNQGATFGALFITFNVDGNPKKARAYYKAINGQVIDAFDIFAD